VSNGENMQRLTDFIIERHHIYMERSKKKKKPWTRDPILQDYRFCNVYRELDNVTRWITKHWRAPNRNDPDLWFAMSVARWVNWPETLAEIGYPVPWKPKHFIEVLYDRAHRGEKVWTGAYMIGTQGNAMDKPLFIAQGVLTPLWNQREAFRPKPGTTLESFARPIINVKNQGTFMVGQMVADTKYADPNLLKAPDWFTWAVSGPGSRRGLNRLLSRPIEQGWSDKAFLEELNKVQNTVNQSLPATMGLLHAQDMQNCLCEFDKYERVRLGQGKPRSRYQGRG
jgi:hypothetical protein